MNESRTLLHHWHIPLSPSIELSMIFTASGPERLTLDDFDAMIEYMLIVKAQRESAKLSAWIDYSI